jgi:ParB-like chromosome segregation protein Spo0J
VLVDTDEVGSCVMAMLENLQREDLNFFERRRIRSLIEPGGLIMTKRELLVKTSRPSPTKSGCCC